MARAEGKGTEKLFRAKPDHLLAQYTQKTQKTQKTTFLADCQRALHLRPLPNRTVGPGPRSGPATAYSIEVCV